MYGKYLYVRFRDNVKLVQRNFGRADTRQSWKMAEEYLQTVKRNKNTKLNQPTPTLINAIDLFINKNSNLTTWRSLITVSNHLKANFANDTSLSNIDQKDIDAFCCKLLKEAAVPTVRTYLRSAKPMFRFFYKNKWIYQDFLSANYLDSIVTETIREYEKTLPSLKNSYLSKPKYVWGERYNSLLVHTRRYRLV